MNVVTGNHGWSCQCRHCRQVLQNMPTMARFEEFVQDEMIRENRRQGWEGALTIGAQTLVTIAVQEAWKHFQFPEDPLVVDDLVIWGINMSEIARGEDHF